MIIDETTKKIKSEDEYEKISLKEVEDYFSMSDKGAISQNEPYFWAKNKKDIMTVAIIILVGTGSFGLGKLSNLNKEKVPVKIYDSSALGASTSMPVKASPTQEVKSLNPASAVQAINNNDKAGMLVGSKEGDKYHYPWCSGAKRIKEENKIWFKTAEEAKKAGYAPAGNCKGLK